MVPASAGSARPIIDHVRDSRPAILSRTVRMSAGVGIPRMGVVSGGSAPASGSEDDRKGDTPDPSSEIAIDAPGRDIRDAFVAAVVAFHIGRAVGASYLLDDKLRRPADVHL